ncbi:MAG: hypothetical protein IJ944_01890 [Clostridia bacterium]|nr:hypothetical protein [Clostridia bacterium]
MLRSKESKKFLTIYEICIFALLGTIMYCSKMLMEALPNIHLLGMFTMVCAIVYRFKGLIPIYVYVFLQGLLSGFSLWWVPYLYIWTVLWGITMLIPKNIPDKIAVFVYPIVCGLHGLMFGTLFAPVQAIAFGYDFNMMIKWIIAGLPFDAVHCIGDLLAGILVLPVAKILKKISYKR